MRSILRFLQPVMHCRRMCTILKKPRCSLMYPKCSSLHLYPEFANTRSHFSLSSLVSSLLFFFFFSLLVFSTRSLGAASRLLMYECNTNTTGCLRDLPFAEDDNPRCVPCGVGRRRWLCRLDDVALIFRSVPFHTVFVDPFFISSCHHNLAIWPIWLYDPRFFISSRH